MIKISKLAKDLGVTKTTLYNWHRKKQIDFVKNSTGMNYVTVDTYNTLMGIKEHKEQKVVIYCRAGSSADKSCLKTQESRMVSYCNAKGYKIHKVVSEVGSGTDDERKLLVKLLKDNNYTKIVVEHKDRLTRVGFNYLKTLVEAMGKDIEVVNAVDTVEDDLMQDFVSMVTSFCARIYGRRRSRRKTGKLIAELSKEI